jgi:hypothetical protein
MTLRRLAVIGTTVYLVYQILNYGPPEAQIVFVGLALAWALGSEVLGGSDVDQDGGQS